MSDWKTKQIKQLGRVVTGKTPPKVRPDYFDGNELFVSPKDFDWNGGYVEKTQTTITEKALRAFRNQVLPRNSILFTSISFGFGKMAIASRRLLTNQQINSVIANDDHHFRFIYYLLRAYTPVIFSYNSGIDTPIVPKSVFEKIEVKCPELELQRKIAAILTAYDDLIETNKRRIAILEKMADEIYREWFVRMRFPDHKNIKFIKAVPENWRVVELREVCDEASKSTRPGTHLSNRYYLPLDSLATARMLPTDHYDYTVAQSSLALFEKGDILFGAMRPYQRKVVVAPFSGVTRTTMFVIRPKKDHLHAYTYLTLFQQSSIEYATLICNGADRPYAVWNRAMERMKIFLPDTDVLIAFEKIAGPVLSNIQEYYFIQRKLAETRDLLLPRLISGKLSVADLEIQFPPSMCEEPENIDRKDRQLREEAQRLAISQERSKP